MPLELQGKFDSCYFILVYVHYVLRTFRKNLTADINVLPFAVNVATISFIPFAPNAVETPSSVDTSITFMEIN